MYIKCIGRKSNEALQLQNIRQKTSVYVTMFVLLILSLGQSQNLSTILDASDESTYRQLRKNQHLEIRFRAENEKVFARGGV